MISVDHQSIGFHQCEYNAHTTILEANELFRNSHYRQSAFFSLVALEEIGKGLFLLDSYESGIPLKEGDWINRVSFFGHLPKMQRAREEHVKRMHKDIRELFPNLFFKIPIKIAVIGFSEEDVEKLWRLRNRLQFVDYNFGMEKWDHPQGLQNLKDMAYDCLNKATLSFFSLENSLHEKGHDTLLTF